MVTSQPAGPPDARTVLNRYHQAMRDKSADGPADLYAVDAVHELPFSAPGFPERFEGREEVRAGYRAAWGAGPFRVVEITDVVVHGTTGPGTVIAGHVAVVESARGERARVPGLLIIEVDEGLITRVRDYMDAPAVARAAASAAGRS
ncbi:nuclear transport factor 2 family protein [Streptomyces sp. ITFR-6]|uniref:nuclear transport factor 2 family protein n=1 Tax=Streptomyces sp. ITFR-6 TaxID=3075197 RepID=UPI00288A8D74|nr:nuclear transport factor 2 family protein [Streptomyces sp. ITFR-6]WNI33190.1 nuclear transport factor 2 family protein [Streptomyces sp. ITFR-6]